MLLLDIRKIASQSDEIRKTKVGAFFRKTDRQKRCRPNWKHWVYRLESSWFPWNREPKPRLGTGKCHTAMKSTTDNADNEREQSHSDLIGLPRIKRQERKTRDANIGRSGEKKRKPARKGRKSEGEHWGPPRLRWLRCALFSRPYKLEIRVASTTRAHHDSAKRPSVNLHAPNCLNWILIKCALQYLHPSPDGKCFFEYNNLFPMFHKLAALTGTAFTLCFSRCKANWNV